MYRFLFKNFLSRLPPEFAHRLAFIVIKLLPVSGLGAVVGRWTRPDPSLGVEAMGLRFPSPFGLAAGPDKDGKSLRGLAQLGFGHIEVGTLTAHPQHGNPKPRLFRLVEDRALINRMGFNNRGAASAAKRLAREYARPRTVVIGANIGKSRITDLEHATEDYVTSTRLLRSFVDYFVINVSSPNTPGLRGLQDPGLLKPLVRAVVDAAEGRPVLVKIAPDLEDSEIRRIARLAVKEGLSGVVATNTTLARSNLRSQRKVIEKAGQGGLSGPPIAARSMEILTLVRSVVPADFCVISVGGVVTADDVQERIRAGATLVQGYTSFLYQGPLWARKINVGLLSARATSEVPTRSERQALGSSRAPRWARYASRAASSTTNAG